MKAMTQPKCYCQREAVIRTSWTEWNLGRRFYSCPHFWRPIACDYFNWLDEQFGPRPTEVINGLLQKIDAIEIGTQNLARVEAENVARVEVRNGLNIKWKIVIVSILIVVVLVMCS